MSGNIARVAAIAVAGGAAAYAGSTDVRFAVASALTPLLRALDPETAHHLGILAASWGLLPADRRPDSSRLALTLWGRPFSNPLGIAAGFDKDAKAIDSVLDLGVGFMEVGSITPQPQPGNPRPRCWRLPEAGAVINRYGFNSEGAEAAVHRVEAYNERRHTGRASPGKVLFVNLGKNKETEDAAADYEAGVAALAGVADAIVVNISSPNTPGLRQLQARAQLRSLITRVQAALAAAEYPAGRGRPPLLVKIAPDLDAAGRADIAAVALETRVDGLVISNTTTERPASVAGHPAAAEAGGLSGAPLFAPSTALLADMYRRTHGRIPLVGCGGVASGRDAFDKILAGASLVELYTALVYHGPAAIPRIKAELLECLEEGGFQSVQDAVGRGNAEKGGGWLARWRTGSSRA